MLKRLELIGFKSFADKTRFDFHEGITAVVGPNGSGKSNIVDAVRWILGEQSAKSLRGGEMADVIFNGSASRRSLGLAEVTMTFDNSRKILNSDLEEVQVTRRVYRDGTGEYLLNGQICRLKDFKELFLGSGAGPGTYCIIEQGRVDALLQSSTKDRRIIFEEAAGISRFKAKKIETLRKLDSTTLNLSRVKDILGEIENQLKRVRAEASKAQRWREWSDRLKELRIGSGLREYQARKQAIGKAETTLNGLRGVLGETTGQMAEWETETATLDKELAEGDRLLKQHADEGHAAQQGIVLQRGEFGQNLRQAEQIQREIAELDRRLADADDSTKIRVADQSRHEDTLKLAESGVEESQADTDIRQTEWDDLAKAVETQSKKLQEERQRQFELFQEAGRLANEAEKRKGDCRRIEAERDRHRRQAEQRRAERDSFDRGLESLRLNDGELRKKLADVKSHLSERQKERTDFIAWAELIQQELEELRLKREGTRTRVEVLEALEKSQEGLAVGVRAVMERINDGDSELADNVIGLVADLLNVPGELAPFIDLALGDVSQRFIVRDATLLDLYLLDSSHELPGRTSFIPYRNLRPLPEGGDTRTADRWVTCDHPELAGLPRQLLGSTMIVEDLPEARELFDSPGCVGCRFITRRREMLEPDGTLTVGAKSGETGIVSRKSELRELKNRLRLAEEEIQTTEARLAGVKRSIEAAEAPLHGLEHELGLLNRQAGDVERAIEENRRKREELAGMLDLLASELAMMEQETLRLQGEWTALHDGATETKAAAEASTARIADGERRLKECELRKPASQQALTEARVRLAQREVERDNRLAERDRMREELRRHLLSVEQLAKERMALEQRLDSAMLAALDASAALAVLHFRKESSQDCEGEQSHRRELLRTRRAWLEDHLRQVRNANRQKLAELHESEMALHDQDSQRKTLCERLLEEYQIDLSVLYDEANESPFAAWLGEVEPVSNWQAEANDLRDKIRKLGGVSIDSLAELDEITARSKEIQTQYDDLTDAHRSLHEIMAKINGDSQRMLAETMATIREHFQDIFRQLFGGGSADIVLEDPNDILETGMEIIARPPGKELRSISLMSGGEKTMTAVALLLAIFRSKPSPFCLLDEVDAALDEANCQRLATALRQFTQQSQFIVITHKKRMMATADVLHGITMQESGISKQITIRFEDWPEEKEVPRLAA